MAQANVYLSFDRNCAEAMNFYKNALGGELELQKVGESGMAAHMPAEMHDQVMHSMLTSGSITLMASDMVSNDKLVNGNGYTIALICDSEEEINRHFKNLSEGGTVVEPLATAPWGAIFGMLTDKFGKHWMFNYTIQK